MKEYLNMNNKIIFLHNEKRIKFVDNRKIEEIFRSPYITEKIIVNFIDNNYI